MYQDEEVHFIQIKHPFHLIFPDSLCNKDIGSIKSCLEQFSNKIFIYQPE